MMMMMVMVMVWCYNYFIYLFVYFSAEKWMLNVSVVESVCWRKRRSRWRSDSWWHVAATQWRQERSMTITHTQITHSTVAWRCFKPGFQPSTYDDVRHRNVQCERGTHATYATQATQEVANDMAGICHMIRCVRCITARYAFARRRLVAEGCPCVRPCVRGHTLKVCEHDITQTACPNFTKFIGAVWETDELIRFWGQKVRGQGNDESK